MTDTRNTTCEERIDANLASRVEDLTAIYEAMNNDGGEVDGEWRDFDSALEALDEYALCIDVRTTMVVQISTGGPGDQLEITIEKGQHGWELASNEATYRFLDWFDGATRRTDNDAVMHYLGSMVERLSW